MVIAFRAFATDPSGVVTSELVAKPAGTVDNDIILGQLFIETTQDPVTGLTTTGFTAVQDQYNGTGLAHHDVVRYKRAASEGANYTWSWTSSLYANMGLFSYSGCVTTGSPINASSKNSGSGTTATLTGITTTVPNCMLLAIITNSTGAIYTFPAGWTKRTAAGENGVELADRLIGAAGATGDIAVTMDTSGPWTAILVALAPPAPTAALTGTVTASITEADIVAGGKTAIVTITGDTLVSNANQLVGMQDGSFAGTTSAQTITFALTGGLGEATPKAGDLVVVAYGVGSTVDRSLAIRTQGAVNYTLAGTELTAADTFDANLRVGYRWMGIVPDGAVVLTETVGGGTGNVADAGAYHIRVYRGVDSATPMDAAVTTATGIDSHAANPPSITPVTAGAIVVCFGAAAMGTGAAFTSASLSNFLSQNQAGTNDVVLGGGDFAWSSGPFDCAAFGGGGAGTTTDSWCAVTLALRPALAFDNARAAIRTGVDSAQSEATGFDALRDTIIPLGNIVRTNATTITATFAAAPTFNITAPETITPTVPGTALVGGAAVVATPTFTIDPGVTTGTAAGAFSALTGAAAGTQRQTGTAAGTFAALTGSATARMLPSGVAAGAFAALTGSASGAQRYTGTGAGSFAALNGSAAGTQRQIATGAGTFAALSGAAVGAMQPSGVGAGSFSALVGSAAGAQTYTATGAGTFAALVGAAIGAQSQTATGAGTFAAIVGSASGAQSQVATAAGTFASLTGSATGTVTASAAGAGTFSALVGSATGAMQPSGVGAGAFAALVGSATGAQTVTGTAAGALAALVGTASGAMQPSGTGAGAFAALTGSASGAQRYTATGAGAFAALIGAGTGAVSFAGVGAGAFAALTGATAGTQTVSATADGTFAALTGAATGTSTASGTAAGAFSALVGSATGAQPFSGTAAGTLAALVGAAVGSHVYTATGAGTFSALTGAASGSHTSAGNFSGTAAGTFSALTGSATGAQSQSGTSAGSFAALIGAASGAMQPTGTGAGTFAALTGAALGAQRFTATAAGTFLALVGSATGTQRLTGTAAGTFAAIVGSASGVLTLTGTAAGTFSALTGSATAFLQPSGTGAGTFGALTGAATGASTGLFDGTAAGTFASLTGSAVGLVFSMRRMEATLRVDSMAATVTVDAMTASITVDRMAGSVAVDSMQATVEVIAGNPSREREEMVATILV